MTFKEIQDLIKLVDKSELAEFKLKKGDTEVLIRTKNFTKNTNTIQSTVHHPMPSVVAAPASVAQAAAPVAAPAASESNGKDADAIDTSNLLEVRSPIVGTFYRSPSPDKDVFVKVGDSINTGDVVCIVEAMKLFNEIETEISGKIVKVMIEDASPVEYDQVLFLVDPQG